MRHGPSRGQRRRYPFFDQSTPGAADIVNAGVQRRRDRAVAPTFARLRHVRLQQDARLSVGGFANSVLADLCSTLAAATRRAASASKVLRTCDSTSSARITAWTSESPRSSSIVGLWRSDMALPFGVVTKCLAQRAARRVDSRREGVLPVSAGIFTDR